MRKHDISEVTKIKQLQNGYVEGVKVGATTHDLYFCTDTDFCPEREDGFTVAEFSHTWYDSVFVVLPGRTTDFGAVFDIAVRFLLDNDIAFDYAESTEEAENSGFLDDNGEVQDAVEYCDDPWHIYIGVANFHIREEETLCRSKIISDGIWVDHEEAWMVYHSDEDRSLGNESLSFFEDKEKAVAEFQSMLMKWIGKIPECFDPNNHYESDGVETVGIEKIMLR